MQTKKDNNEIVAFQIVAKEWRKKLKHVKFSGHHNNGRPIINAQKRRRKVKS